MFGRGKNGQMPKEIPPKPEIAPLRTWNISWGFGNERTVEAHYARRIGDEIVFTRVTGYEYAWNGLTESGCWKSKPEIVFRASGYIYVEEVANGTEDDPGSGED